MPTQQECEDLVRYYGGWEYVPAEVAAAMQYGCPNFASWIGDLLESQFRSNEPAIEPEWRGDEEGGSAVPATPTVEGGGDVNFAGWFGDMGSPVSGAIIPSWTGELIEDFAQVATPMPPIIERGVEAIGNAVQQLFGPQEEIQSGVSARPRCWTNPRYAKSRRMKVVRIPDPSAAGGFRLEARAYCAPRKMNYCNPRALGRAARRLGGFQKMSGAIEKVIARAIKSKSRGRRSYSCAPKRRCR